ncbi:MAG: hypothetical protein U0992_15870 [Planctomycetaceae bacterium]
MPVFRWGNAFDAIRDLEREMDRWLRSVNFTMEGVRAGRAYPAVNIYELDEEFLLTAELPGAKAEGSGAQRLRRRRHGLRLAAKRS